MKNEKGKTKNERETCVSYKIVHAVVQSYTPNVQSCKANAQSYSTAALLFNRPAQKFF